MIYCLWDVIELPLNQFGSGTGVSLSSCGLYQPLERSPEAVGWHSRVTVTFPAPRKPQDHRQEGKFRDGDKASDPKAVGWAEVGQEPWGRGV